LKLFKGLWSNYVEKATDHLGAGVVDLFFIWISQ
jgi:hypothetical protein